MSGSYVILEDRGVVAVRGPEALPFLQNIVTTDVEAVGEGAAAYGGLLTPQGKVLFDFIIQKAADGYLLDTPRAAVSDLAKRLGFYRLRAKVDIANLSATHRVVAAWGSDQAPDASFAADPRLPALGFRAIVASETPRLEGWTPANADAYHAYRVALGVPEGSVDFTFGDAFPHDADMDQLGGIDFRKGCYIGQEVVSRMEHRGTARRRIVVASSPGHLPPPGAPITADGKPLGQLLSVAGRHGLAQIRVDRAKAAMDAGVAVLAAEVPLTLVLPQWARFGWTTGPTED